MDNLSEIGDDSPARLGEMAVVGLKKPLAKGDLSYYYAAEGGLLGNSSVRHISLRNNHNSFDEHKLIVRRQEIFLSPINFGLDYRVNDDITIDAHAGMFLTWALIHRIKDKGATAYTYCDDFYFSRYKHPMAAGFTLGAGVWWQDFNLDLQLMLGPMPSRERFIYTRYYYSNNRPDYSHSYEYIEKPVASLCVRLGYRF